jgi:outer membrane protein OmpA-like peptidoglycan-associated protein
VFAQAQIPSPEQMVEQLKTPPRTRSLRNLKVEPASATQAQGTQTSGAPSGVAASEGQQAAPPRPSLSLSIQFDFDSARIRPESLVVLGNLAAALASPALQASPFVIEGHTDAKGAADYNRKLSAQRAQAVKDLLVAKGIDAARLVSVGKGSSELANASAPLAAENRRVKIVNQD